MQTRKSFLKEKGQQEEKVPPPITQNFWLHYRIKINKCANHQWRKPGYKKELLLQKYHLA